MRTLAANLEFLTQGFIFNLQVLYLHLKYCYLFMSIISYKLKVLRVSVILLILNRTRRIFGVFMVNNLPAMQTSTQCPCNYKAMFKNIATLLNHRVKEIIGLEFYFCVSPIMSYSTTPEMIGSPKFNFRSIGTSAASLACWNAPLNRNPSFLATVNTSVPNKCASTTFVMLSNIAYFIHTIIITQQPKVLKGGIYA